MTAALVLGANGQDGTFLVRELLRRGYDVVGLGMEPQPRDANAEQRYRYRRLDVREGRRLAELLNECRPGLVFHFAAVHSSSAGPAYEPIFHDMLAVNVAAAHTILEHIRTENPGARLLYASSAKVFGTPLPVRIDEETPQKSECLYSITKNAAGALVRYYREQHRIQGSVVYLFNHESELRPSDFFVPRLVACLDAARCGKLAKPVLFRSLDFFCDWGSAEEYMAIAVDALEQAPGEDFVLATGRCVHARALVAQLFASHGLDANRFVAEQQPLAMPPPVAYSANTSKIARLVGRAPARSIEAVIGTMLHTL